MTARRRPTRPPATLTDVVLFLVVIQALFLLTCGAVVGLLLALTSIRLDAAVLLGIAAGVYVARRRFSSPHLRSPFVWRRR